MERIAQSCVLALVITTYSFAQDAKPSARIDLGKGIVATIDSVRSWESYDGEVPKYAIEYWQTAKKTVIKPMGVYGQTSLMVGGTSETTIGEDSFKSTIMPFASVDYPSGLRAAGRFVEVGLRLANTGSAAASLLFIEATKTKLDASIGDAESRYPVKAFLVPGMSIAPVSMITEWGGGLGVSLTPGKATWLLLVFDLPPMIKGTNFRILNSKAIKIGIPDWQKILPSSTFYTGEIVKGPASTAQSGANSFSRATFSFWLTPDRSGIIKFSVTLNDARWLQDGASAAASGPVTTAFSDFTLGIANNKLNASIPSCYDVLGEFTSPTEASGRIHLHHLSVDDSNSSIDFGSWDWKAAAAKEREYLQSSER
jgi:hypothetical protein